MTTQNQTIPEVRIRVAAETLKLLADPTRLSILWALLHGEHSVNELAEHVGAFPAAVSQHLAKLRLAGLVNPRREGNRMFYRVADDHVGRLVQEALSHAHHKVEDLTDDHHHPDPTIADAHR